MDVSTQQVIQNPDGHFKIPHLWSRKLLHLKAGQRWFFSSLWFCAQGFPQLLSIDSFGHRIQANGSDA
jgi:hypothetical protein